MHAGYVQLISSLLRSVGRFSAALLVLLALGCKERKVNPENHELIPSGAKAPEPDGRLPEGCTLAARIDLVAMRSVLSRGALEAVSKLAGAEGLSLLRSTGLDPNRDFYWAELCRKESSDGQPALVRFIGRPPTDFLMKLATQRGGETASLSGAMVLKHDRVWIAQRGATELVFANSEALLGAMLENRTRRYPFTPGAAFALVFDQTGFQNLMRKFDVSQLPEFGSIEALVVDIDRHYSTMSAHLILRDAAEAFRLEAGISKAMTAWRRASKTTIEPTTRVDGRETTLSFPIPPGTVEALLARVESVPRPN